MSWYSLYKSWRLVKYGQLHWVHKPARLVNNKTCVRLITTLIFACVSLIFFDRSPRSQDLVPEKRLNEEICELEMDSYFCSKCNPFWKEYLFLKICNMNCELWNEALWRATPKFYWGRGQILIIFVNCAQTIPHGEYCSAFPSCHATPPACRGWWSHWDPPLGHTAPPSPWCHPSLASGCQGQGPGGQPTQCSGTEASSQSNLTNQKLFLARRVASYLPWKYSEELLIPM